MVAAPPRRRAWFSLPEEDPRALALQAHNLLTKDRVGERWWNTELFISSSGAPASGAIVVNEIHFVTNPFTQQPAAGQILGRQ